MAALAQSRKCQLSLSFAVMAIFLFSLTFLPHKSGGIEASSILEEQMKKMILGSRPPACVNKCMECRPCLATLIIPPRQNTINNYQKYSFGRDREDDSYYLLSWKCRCGNKFYQP